MCAGSAGSAGAGAWWPELLLGLAGEPRFAGAQPGPATTPWDGQFPGSGGSADADDGVAPGADAVELLRRVQEILAACKDPSMHLG